MKKLIGWGGPPRPPPPPCPPPGAAPPPPRCPPPAPPPWANAVVIASADSASAAKIRVVLLILGSPSLEVMNSEVFALPGQRVAQARCAGLASLLVYCLPSTVYRLWSTVCGLLSVVFLSRHFR